MARHNETGKLGEALAKKYFEERGYEVIHENWRHSHWEIDLIATRNNILHIIEVKTRRGYKTGNPEEKNDRKKITYLINAAEAFTHLNPQWTRLQFDVLAITLINDSETDYFLLEDVYL